MTQLDLFAVPEPEPERTCGACVVWNGYDAGTTGKVGGCSVWGTRRSDEEACDRWFPKTELNRALYGRDR